MTVRSATRSTTTERLVAFSGNTRRASKFPNGSCCQLRKWSLGSTVSEYDRIGVRLCGAGRSRTTCGVSPTGRSNGVDGAVLEGDVDAHDDVDDSVSCAGK